MCSVFSVVHHHSATMCPLSCSFTHTTTSYLSCSPSPANTPSFKVLETDQGREQPYLIHYQGWKERYDDWVDSARIQKYDKEKYDKAKRATKKAARSTTKKATTLTLVPSNSWASWIPAGGSFDEDTDESEDGNAAFVLKRATSKTWERGRRGRKGRGKGGIPSH